MGREAAARTARLDRLNDMLPTPNDGPTTADLLDAVSDPEARAILQACAVALHFPPTDSTGVAPRHAAVWLWRGLWSHATGDPSLADLVGMVSASLPWPDPTGVPVPQE